MGITIYNCARQEFATAGMDWELDAMRCAIPILGYAPDLAGDTSISRISPMRRFIDVTGRSVDIAGWLKCDLLLFATIPVGENIDRVTIYRVSDGMLLFDISFPVINVPTSVPLVLMQDVSSPGLCRL